MSIKVIATRRDGRLGAWRLRLLRCWALGALLTLFSVLLNTVPRGGGLDLSDARNGGSGEGGGNRFAACTSGVFKRVCYPSIEKFYHRERRNIIRPSVPSAELVGPYSPFHVRASKANILSVFRHSVPPIYIPSGRVVVLAMLSVALTSSKHVRASFQEKTGFPITA
jgi:hypothetical protein